MGKCNEMDMHQEPSKDLHAVINSSGLISSVHYESNCGRDHRNAVLPLLPTINTALTPSPHYLASPHYTYLNPHYLFQPIPNPALTTNQQSLPTSASTYQLPKPQLRTPSILPSLPPASDTSFNRTKPLRLRYPHAL
ncbi:hypothetical protein Pmani_001113 [Petrolisthes manimaculis]|uniref:Uncharacterized protein n=1 Tax=Petrolisthes manimaculis TaxID=1843537 RepID=A0AAE1QLG7_9EUCA|nr:hypothetical protein Pmani_001113 [Petrolisthes manimaculis]